MLILIHGEETFFSRQKLLAAVAYWRGKYGRTLDFMKISASESSYEDFIEFCRRQSIFQPRKFVVLEEVFRYPAFSKKLSEYLKENSELCLKQEGSLNLVLYHSERVAAANPLFALVKSHGKIQTYGKLSYEKRTRYIKQAIKRHGLNFSREALGYFMLSVGEDMWRADRELKKISSFYGKNHHQTIAKEDLAGFIAHSSAQSRAFPLLDAIARRNVPQSFFLWRELLAQNKEPLATLGAILWQIKNLYAARSLVDKGFTSSYAVKALGMHPFAAMKSFQHSKNFTLQEMKHLYAAFFELDINLKTGREDPSVGFERIVTNL